MTNKTTFEGLPDGLPLSEERELLRQDRTQEEVRNKLLLHSLKDGLKYAATCCEGKIGYDELLSLVTIAVLQAIKNYDLSHTADLTLIQFAKSYIRGEVKRYWKNLNIVNYGDKIPADTSTETLDSIRETEIEDFDWTGINVRERWGWVQPHYDKLTETERRVLILIFESRFSLSDIGRMFDCTRENIRTTKLRALMKIRNGLYREKKLLAE